MRNPVSKKLTSINIFFLIFKFFRAGHHYSSNGNASYCGTYRQKAALLFDKIVRKAELLHMSILDKKDALTNSCDTTDYTYFIYYGIVSKVIASINYSANSTILLFLCILLGIVSDQLQPLILVHQTKQ